MPAHHKVKSQSGSLHERRSAERAQHERSVELTPRMGMYIVRLAPSIVGRWAITSLGIASQNRRVAAMPAAPFIVGVIVREADHPEAHPVKRWHTRGVEKQG